MERLCGWLNNVLTQGLCVWLSIGFLHKFCVWPSIYVMWLWMVWQVMAKHTVRPGGTLVVHGRNPSEGSAVSARPAGCFAINTKPFVRIFFYHFSLYFAHTHSYLSSNPLTSHCCEDSFVAKKFTSTYKVTSIQLNVARLVSLASCRLCVVYTSFDCVL